MRGLEPKFLKASAHVPLAEDAELLFTDSNDVWKALPLVEKCLRMEIPDILNNMQDKLDEQFRLGKVAGLKIAVDQVIQDAVDIFKYSSKDSDAVAVRKAASHLQKMLDAWRVAMGLHYNHELAVQVEETEARLAGEKEEEDDER